MQRAAMHPAQPAQARTLTGATGRPPSEARAKPNVQAVRPPLEARAKPNVQAVRRPMEARAKPNVQADGGIKAPPYPTQENNMPFPTRDLIADYQGAPYVHSILDIATQGSGGANTAMSNAVGTLGTQAGLSGARLDDVSQQLGGLAGQIQGIPTDLGSAFDTSGARHTLDNLNTDFGSAFDTSMMRDTLTGMDYAGLQDRYQSQYVDQMVDPALARMREDEARRMAQLEASGAAIGGGGNTRMAVEMARTTDEGMRSRGEMEANLRNQALRQAQELGLQEAGMRGNMAQTAAQLGLSETELEGRLREASSRAKADFTNMAAQLGLSESQLQAEIAEKQARLGMDQAAATQAVLQDKIGIEGAQFGMASDLAALQGAQGQTALDAAKLGITGAGIGLEQAELARQIQTEQNQIPLTMEAWYRDMVSTPTQTTLPGGGTQTQSGGGPGVGTQLVGAGTSLLGSAMLAGLGPFSDERIKDDITPLNNALDIIRRQRPSEYRYSDPKYDRVPVEGRRSAGLMAQDLEDIPGAVIEHESGYKMVDPYPVMATIAAAVQELDRKVEGLHHV